MNRWTGQPVNGVRVGMAGIGGYGGSLVQLIENSGAAVNPPVTLAGVFEAFPDRHNGQVTRLESRGVPVCDDFDRFLGLEGLDAVWLPVPIHLHAAYTSQAVAAGLPVMCEKPAAATVGEVDRMIATRDRAGVPVLLGFQEIYHPTTHALKRKLLSGELGAVREVRVIGCWPRRQSYFRRNDWAGRYRLDGRTVDDSPLSNALAHFANLALYFAGPTLQDSATPRSVEAHTFRAHDIENYDTVSLRARLDTGVDLLTLFTLACRTRIDPTLLILCERGRVERTLSEVRITPDRGAVERWPMVQRDRTPMLQCFASVVRGQTPPGHTLATLEMGRDHTALVEAVSRATRPRSVAPQRVHREDDEDDLLLSIDGIERLFSECFERGVLPDDASVGGPATPHRAEPVMIKTAPALRPGTLPSRTRQ